MMPLTLIRAGESACITRITGKDETRRHLENLGFVIGEKVEVISVIAGNPIVNVKGARIALDKDMAKRILV